MIKTITTKRQRRDEATEANNGASHATALPSHSPAKRPRLDTVTDAAGASSGTIQATARSQQRQQQQPQQKRTPPPQLPHPYADLLRDLTIKYSIATASIISSSKIEAKVTAMLNHLSRFDIADLSVLPGITFLYGRAGEASKLVTVVEVVKRRVEEIHQPWYQYNGVYEMPAPAEKVAVRHGKVGDGSVVEDTVLGTTSTAGTPQQEGLGDDGEEDEFEVMQDTFEAAVRNKPKKERMVACMSVFLSRVPVPELLAKSGFTLQTNAAEIAKWRREQNINAS